MIEIVKRLIGGYDIHMYGKDTESYHADCLEEAIEKSLKHSPLVFGSQLVRSDIVYLEEEQVTRIEKRKKPLPGVHMGLQSV